MINYYWQVEQDLKNGNLIKKEFILLEILMMFNKLKISLKIKT